MLYLRNLPNLRFMEAKKIKSPCRIIAKNDAFDHVKVGLENAVKRNKSLVLNSY